MEGDTILEDLIRDSKRLSVVSHRKAILCKIFFYIFNAIIFISGLVISIVYSYKDKIESEPIVLPLGIIITATQGISSILGLEKRGAMYNVIKNQSKTINRKAIHMKLSDSDNIKELYKEFTDLDNTYYNTGVTTFIRNHERSKNNVV